MDLVYVNTVVSPFIMRDEKFLCYINNTDSVELSLEKQYVKFVWFCLNSLKVVVKKIFMFVPDHRPSILKIITRYGKIIFIFLSSSDAHCLLI